MYGLADAAGGDVTVLSQSSDWCCWDLSIISLVLAWQKTLNQRSAFSVDLLSFGLCHELDPVAGARKMAASLPPGWVGYQVG